jgi:hypothetical protein
MGRRQLYLRGSGFSSMNPLAATDSPEAGPLPAAAPAAAPRSLSGERGDPLVITAIRDEGSTQSMSLLRATGNLTPDTMADVKASGLPEAAAASPAAA